MIRNVADAHTGALSSEYSGCRTCHKTNFIQETSFSAERTLKIVRFLLRAVVPFRSGSESMDSIAPCTAPCPLDGCILAAIHKRAAAICKRHRRARHARFQIQRAFIWSGHETAHRTTAAALRICAPSPELSCRPLSDRETNRCRLRYSLPPRTDAASYIFI